jgi:hypothetical protein
MHRQTCERLARQLHAAIMRRDALVGAVTEALLARSERVLSEWGGGRGPRVPATVGVSASGLTSPPAAAAVRRITSGCFYYSTGGGYHRCLDGVLSGTVLA